MLDETPDTDELLRIIATLNDEIFDLKQKIPSEAFDINSGYESSELDHKDSTKENCDQKRRESYGFNNGNNGNESDSDIETEIFELHSQIAELSSNNEAYQAEIENYKQILLAKENKMNELEQFNKQMEEQIQQTHELGQISNIKDPLSSLEAEQLRSRNRVLEIQLNSSQKEITQLKQEINKREEQYLQEITRLGNEIQQVSKTINHPNKESSSANQMLASEIISLHEHIKDQNYRIEDLQNKLLQENENNRKIQALMKERENSQINKPNLKLHEDALNLQKSLNTLFQVKTTKEIYEKVQNCYNAAQNASATNDSNAILSQQLQDEIMKNLDLEKQISNQSEILNSQDSSSEKLYQLESHIHSLEEQIKILKLENDTLRHTNIEEFKKLKIENQNLKLNINAKSKTSFSDDEMKRLYSENISLRNTLEATNLNYEKLQIENKRLKSNQDSMNQQLTSVQLEKNNNLSDNIRDLYSRTASLKDQTILTIDLAKLFESIGTKEMDKKYNDLINHCYSTSNLLYEVQNMVKSKPENYEYVYVMDQMNGVINTMIKQIDNLKYQVDVLNQKSRRSSIMSTTSNSSRRSSISKIPVPRKRAPLQPRIFNDNIYSPRSPYHVPEMKLHNRL